ncbi:FAD-binding oxidoreductase [Kribbella sandramycini]|uniref:FAD-binding oxidoreductase n=1 Tax=Kribbella sandramycini TaxID=60450 RepID=A0A7Y4KXL4_9ACTN|nr:FAD-binding oxidoreductase [Kribbella sandramycini]MBB6569659.1 FAD/FMN-containing dehydrogenase [Kribbella sandramycini]NOL40509.1 FAD-binding oxidoreductase [Kribbella sandramycini]
MPELVRPGDPSYDAARRVRNARIDRRPAAIARCAGTADVVAAIDHARAHGLGVAVRGGGANVAGWGTCDGGLVIDTGPMKQLVVDPARQLASAGPGLTWGEFDAGTAPYGLALPGARNTGVGIAGHTLGGGVGDLSRQFGLTSDNLVEAEVVTAAGAVVRATADENPELFWALRGGSGNFGVVTRFTFRLHPVSTVVAGPIVHPYAAVPAALRSARDWLATAPDEASLIAIVWTAPPLPFIPEQYWYERGALLIPTWFGDPARADEVLRPLLTDPAPVATAIRPMAYADYQSLLGSPPDFASQHVYNRGELLPALPDDVLDRILQHWQASGPNYSVVFGALGGAIGRGGPTAFAHREAQWFVELCAQWYGAADSELHVGVAADGWQALQDVTLGPYLNLLPDTDPEWVGAAFGANHERLVAIKQVWDPENLFRFGPALHSPPAN